MQMKYNKSYGENGRDFQEYIEYLDTIKNSIPIDLYNFISNPNRHNFSDESLHDSRIESIQFVNDFEKNCPNMIITLLEVMRKFKFHFISISNYKIEQNCRINDLLTFEVGLEENKYDPEGDYDGGTDLVFRAEFCDGKMELFCEEIRIEEILE